MKFLWGNKKIILITLVFFICGVFLQVIRSQAVLKMDDTNNILDINELVVSANSNREQKDNNINPDYCIVYDQNSIALKNNVEKTLEYMQQSTIAYDIAEEKVKLDNCPTILLNTSSLEDLGTVQEIENYVLMGGNIFLMNLLQKDQHFRLLYNKFGILNYGDYGNTTGIHMKSNVLVGTTGKNFLENSLEDVHLEVSLNNNANVLIESTAQTPLLWSVGYGKGTFMVFNGSLLYEKASRGVISGAISLMEKDFIYPIFNMKLFYIDDFPAPIAKSKNELIYDEYKSSLESFYQSIWWPDMLKTSRDFNILYTGTVIESYTDNVIPPFDDVVDKEYKYLISFGRELVKSGGELALHGYNHQSLTMNKEVSSYFGYKNWKSMSDMEQSIKELIDYTKQAFPTYELTTYVPPSNVLSEEGRQALINSWPELTTISSLYINDSIGKSYFQEFEVSRDGIIELPRITSGYMLTESDDWAIANTLTNIGVFSHFIHPDDVISKDRLSGSWSEMYKEYNKFMQDINENYSWLRSMKASEAARTVASNLQTTTAIEKNKKGIKGSIDRYKNEQHYIVRTEKKMSNPINCVVEKIDKDTYILIALAAQFEVTLEE